MAEGYPRFYAVNDRLVQWLPTAGGEVQAFSLEVPTGIFVPDPSAFERASNPSSDVEALSQAEFVRRLTALKTERILNLSARTIAWSRTGNGEFPFFSGDR